MTHCTTLRGKRREKMSFFLFLVVTCRYRRSSDQALIFVWFLRSRLGLGQRRVKASNRNGQGSKNRAETQPYPKITCTRKNTASTSKLKKKKRKKKKKNTCTSLRFRLLLVWIFHPQNSNKQRLVSVVRWIIVPHSGKFL